ncbi:LysR family transcriptional regulator [Streptomyces luteireticuli]|uniref:LysR family transcriptional regulator n=1 Tax=Streptomyces luteireticuli TaxID=173858 RepID=UPI003557CE8F
MELRQLQYFVAVVEEANFTRAAARLHLAQPGISAQVRQLERELGQPLLNRSGRTVTLTGAGRAVLPHVRSMLATAEEIRRTVDEITGLLRGDVRLGLVSGAATHEFDVADVLSGFHDDHPGVDVSLTEDTSERMVAAVQRGELDIALAGLPGPELPPGTCGRIVVDEPLAALVAPGDPLAMDGRAAVPLAALRDRPLISLPRGSGLRGVLDRACEEAGIRPRIVFEAAAPQLLVRLAERGLGVAVMPLPPAGAPEGFPGKLRTVRLTGPEPRGRIALLWQEGGPDGPAGRMLLERFLKAFEGAEGAGNALPAPRTP